jgi:hypothetical protein
MAYNHDPDAREPLGIYWYECEPAQACSFRLRIWTVVPPLTFDEWDSGVSMEGYSPKPGEGATAVLASLLSHRFLPEPLER